jgi:glucose-1-phosphate thymidylyltransferase
MRQGGVQKAYVVLRDGKWDIPAYLGDGEEIGLQLAYLIGRVPFGVPFTLDQAYDFVRGHRIVCGFPDIITEPEGVFGPLLQRLDETGAAAALALFPADDPQLMDQVQVDGDGRVGFVQVKPGPDRLDSGWVVAAWGPEFTELLHSWVVEASENIRRHGSLEREPHLGDVVQAAIEAGLVVQSVPFPSGSFIDIGAPERLSEIWRRSAEGISTAGEYPDVEGLR